MNFFKALLNINSLREQNQQLEQRNLHLADHNLQLNSQIAMMRDQFVMQESTVRSLKSQYDKAQAELSTLRGKREPKPAPTQQSAKMSVPNNNNNHQNKSRRGRKPKAVNQ